MPRICLFILLFFAFVQLSGQQPRTVFPGEPSEDQAHFLELGISANWLIQQILPDREGTSRPGSSPYLATARWGFAQNQWALRLGLGGNYSRDEFRLEGFGDKEIFYRNSLHVRLGAERRFRMGSRWIASLGLDATAFYENDEETVDSGFDRVSVVDRAKGIGGGPVIGLTYFITPRLACFVEGSILAQYSESEAARLFKNFPQFDDEIERVASTNISVQLPATVYLAFFF